MITIKLKNISSYDEAMREYDVKYKDKYQLVGYRINYITGVGELILAEKEQ